MTNREAQTQSIEWTSDLVKRFWDEESQHPELYFTYQVGPELVRHLRRYLMPGSCVLDFGCGRGHLIRHLLARNCVVTGLDFSPETVSTLGNSFHGEEGFDGAFQPSDLLKTGRRFDSVIAVEVFEHLDDQMLEQSLTLIRNVLKAGGLLIVTVPNEEDLSLSVVRCPQCGVSFHRYQHVRSWDSASLTKRLGTANFEVIRCYTTAFRRNRRWRSVTGVLLAALRAIFRRSEKPNLVCIARVRS
jgi:2-polyprenyl-3-methyl-5-hydroxy-6-metoxy-1,4-benzoquinol methylase